MVSENHIYSFSAPNGQSIELTIPPHHKQVYATNETSEFELQGQFVPDERTSFDQLTVYEWQPIHFLALLPGEITEHGAFTLSVNNRVIARSRYNKHTGQQQINEQITFKNQVGESRLSLRDTKGQLVFGLSFEVFPQKMDFRSDYKAILSDIREIVHNLAYAMLRDTYHSTRPKLVGHATENEWWSILTVLFDALEKSLEIIKRQPQHHIEQISKMMPVNKIQQVGPSEIKWMRQHTNRAQKTKNSDRGIAVGGGKSFDRIRTTRKKVSYDTPENQFVKWAIEQTLTKLIRLERVLFSEEDESYTRVQQTLRAYQGRLQSILHQYPFTEVGSFSHQQSFSTAMTRGSGYRDFLQIYLILNRGLDITDSDIFKMDIKQISELYEYWCYLKIIQLIAEQKDLTIDLRDLIKLKSGRFSVSLQKGKKSEVAFFDEKTGDSIRAYYNRAFPRTETKPITYSQLPDYTIKFKKSGFNTPFWYLFDAKYRFEEKDTDSSFNVPKDAIGQLHRYRDSILHSEPKQSEYLTYKSAIKNLGGVILYPYPNEESDFKTNQFYNSIEEVNIGALPLLPGKTKLATQFLRSLLDETPEGHYEKIIGMDRREYYEEREKWSDVITLVIMPKRFQVKREEFLKKKKLVYVPRISKTHSKLFATKEFLVVPSGQKQAYRCVVNSDGYQLYSRNKLKNLGANWTHRSEEYIGFSVDILEEKVELPASFDLINFRYATRRGLELYKKEKDPSYFYVTNADCARLIKELKHAEYDFSINWVDQKMDPTKVEIVIEEFLTIYSSERYKNLHFTLDKRVGADQLHLEKVRKILQDNIGSKGEKADLSIG